MISLLKSSPMCQSAVRILLCLVLIPMWQWSLWWVAVCLWLAVLPNYISPRNNLYLLHRLPSANAIRLLFVSTLTLMQAFSLLTFDYFIDSWELYQDILQWIKKWYTFYISSNKSNLLFNFIFNISLSQL
jgi:hypothetical protein